MPLTILGIIFGFLGMAQHPEALWIVIYLLAQLLWRGVAFVRRPKLEKIWVIDLVTSILLFAAAIYVPWWTRG